MGNNRKNKYIPHLAEFYFSPKHHWSLKEAQKMYQDRKSSLNGQIHYKDCIRGMKKLDSESIDLVIADPPFGISFSGKEAIYNREKSNIVDQYHEIESNYQDFSNNWIKQLPRIMKQTASAYIISGYTNLKDILIAIDDAGLILMNHIIWKYQFGVFTKKKFVSSHYHILFVVKDPKTYFYHKIEHYVEDVWTNINRTYKMNQMKNGTKLPVGLVQRFIDFSSKPGDLVLDPFMGNATTAVAAKLNFRHYYGFEKNLKMKVVIKNNIENTVLGENYIPYQERLPNPEELAKIDSSYAKAFQYYLEEKEKEVNYISPAKDSLKSYG